MSDVKIGIVIPNHNYAKWIEKSILSAARDPYPHKKIVVVDDGSSDASWPIICKTLGLKTLAQGIGLEGEVEGVPAIAFKFPKAGGPSRARNAGIHLIWNDVDLFGFLDSDDEYLEGKIGKSIEKFKEDPEYTGGVYTDYYIQDELGNIQIEYKEPYSREKLLQSCIIHSACIVNKLALEKSGLYDESLRVAEDYDLWCRISESFNFTHIPEPLMLVRTGSHNSTSTVSEEIWQECHIKLFDKMKKRMNNG